MGKYLNKIKKGSRFAANVGIKVGDKTRDFADKQVNRPKQRFNSGKIREQEQQQMGENAFNYDDDMTDGFGEDDGFNDGYNDVNIQTAQKPASFHHFILENQYKDLEKSIRGYKDVFIKETQQWEVKRKKDHCFNDEESEEILRTAQSHLATDIKLTFYSKETFGIRFLAVYESLEYLFRRIMQYRFGRFGEPKKQGEMKDQALKIFVELITRVEANYLRAIQGMENKLTHQSVQSQESLQGENGDLDRNRGYS